MNIKIFNHSNTDDKYSWLTDFYIQQALAKDGTLVIGDMTYTVNAEKQEATMTGTNHPTETCNYLIECWGYEIHHIESQWHWFTDFEQAAQSRIKYKNQGLSCGPIVNGWK